MEHTDTPAESRDLILKVTLDDSDPPIWRRLRVSDSMTLGELHFALQIAMGWTNSHLHEFTIGVLRYGMAVSEDLDLPHALDENEHTLRSISLRPGTSLKYLYDFGDDWEHTVHVEQEASPDPALPCPACIAGEGGCPPEDCGGIPGYIDLLETLSDPENPGFEDLLEWLPHDFDPEAFPLSVVNAKLGNLGAFGIMAGPADYADGEDEDYPEQHYEEPVCLLLTLGAPEDQETDYSTLGIGPEHVPDLIRMATDMDLHWGYQDSKEEWAPVHAWRALGQLKVEEAIRPMVKLLDLVDELDDDFTGNDLPKVIACQGLAALPELASYLGDASNGPWGRFAASDTLSELGRIFPEHRDACVRVLTEQLQKHNENDEDLNAIIICSLMGLHAIESTTVIESAFAANRVDCSIPGDWEDVQISLGLLEKRITPLPKYSSIRLKNPSGYDEYPEKPLPPPDIKKSQKSKKKRKDQKNSRKKNRRK